MAKTIAESMNGYKVIVNKSTVPIGTGDVVTKIIEDNYKGEFEEKVIIEKEKTRRQLLETTFHMVHARGFFYTLLAVSWESFGKYSCKANLKSNLII